MKHINSARAVASVFDYDKDGSDTLCYYYDSVAELTAISVNGMKYYYVKNLQGDIIGMVDAAGTMVVEYAYDSWGTLLETTGSKASTVGVKNPFRYRGYYYDAEVGLYYLASRYYDPEIRRFISADNFDVVIPGITGVGESTRTFKTLNKVQIPTIDLTSTPNKIGKFGEELAGIDPKAKTMINVNGRTRIPDKMTNTSLIEVKNVKYISYTL